MVKHVQKILRSCMQRYNLIALPLPDSTCNAFPHLVGSSDTCTTYTHPSGCGREVINNFNTHLWSLFECSFRLRIVTVFSSISGGLKFKPTNSSYIPICIWMTSRVNVPLSLSVINRPNKDLKVGRQTLSSRTNSKIVNFANNEVIMSLFHSFRHSVHVHTNPRLPAGDHRRIHFLHLWYSSGQWVESHAKRDVPEQLRGAQGEDDSHW